MDKKELDTKKLDHFLELLKSDYPDEGKLNEIRSILNLWDNRRWSIRFFIVQWYLLGNKANDWGIKEVARYSVDDENPEGLIQRFGIKDSNLVLDYDLTHKNGSPKGLSALNSTILNLRKDGIIFEKEGNNIYLDQLGKICANYLLFYFLLQQISLNKLWDLIKLELTGQNIKNIDLSPKILKDLYIIEEYGEKYRFSNQFESLIDFLQKYPILYYDDRTVIKQTFIQILESAIIQRADNKEVPLTKSNTPLYRYKNHIKEIDWIYSLTPYLQEKSINLMDWVQSAKIDEFKDFPSEILEKYLIIEAPAGYGKSIFLIQESLKMFQFGEIDSEKLILPIIFDTRNFRVSFLEECTTLFFNNYQIMDLRKSSSDPLVKLTVNTKIILEKLFIAGLANYYQITELSLKIYLAILKQTTFVIIFDGWDEVQPQARQYIRKLIEFLQQTQIKLKVIFASRFVDETLQNFTTSQKSISKFKKPISAIIKLNLPTREMAIEYLRIITKKEIDEQKIVALETKFKMPLTPLDLYLVGIFPQFSIPDFRGELYERWIYFHSLVDYVDRNNLRNIKNIHELRELLDSTKIIRDADGKEGFLRDWIEGNILAITDEDTKNYGLFNILPLVCYSWIDPITFPHFKYSSLITQNPILRHFLSPYYEEGLQLYAGIQDYHLIPYFIARFIFNSFMNDAIVTPIYHPTIEDFLKDFFNQNLNNPIFIKCKIKTSDQFVNHLYLRSKIAFPALNLSYHGGSDAAVGFSIGSETISYGQFLIKAFEFEHKKALQQQNYTHLIEILDEFNEFLKNRPTITHGFYLDSITNETEIGDPEINHEPTEFFNTVCSLLDLPKYPQKSEKEIEFEGNRWENYIQSYDSRGWERKYLQKDNYRQILKRMIESENIYILPWLGKIFDTLPNDVFPEINQEVLIDRFKQIIEKPIELSILKILLKSARFKIKDHYETIKAKNNIELLDLVLKQIYSSQKISIEEDDFILWIKLYETPSLKQEQKKILLRKLFRVNLLPNQLKILEQFYDEEFEIKLKYIIFCLLIIYGYSKFSVHQISEEIQFALQNFEDHFDNRIYFFTLLTDNIEKDKIQKAFLQLNFFDAFAISPDLSLKNGLSYSKQENNMLKHACNLIKSLQLSWWEKNRPKTLPEIKELLKGCFIHSMDYKSYTIFIPNSNFETKKEYIYQPIDKILSLLNEFKEFHIEIANEIFEIVKKDYIEGDKKPTSKFSESKPRFITVFLQWASLRITEEMKILWLQKFIPSSWDYDSYNCLFQNLSNLNNLYPLIRETIGEQWMIISDHLPWKREKGGQYFNKQKLTYYLPFNELDNVLKSKFDWDNLCYQYKSQIQNLTSKIPKEISNKFLLALYNYIQNLSAIGNDEAVRINAELWNDFYLFPIINREEHPSYVIFRGVRREILQKVYQILPNSPAKVFLLLGLIQTQNFYFEKHNFLSQLLELDPDLISNSIEQIFQTDWDSNSKFLLLIFTNYSENLIPALWSFIEYHASIYYGSIYYDSYFYPSFEWIFEADASISIFDKDSIIKLPDKRLLTPFYLKRYNFLVNVLNHEIPDQGFLRRLPLDSFDNEYDIILNTIQSLPIKQTDHPFPTLNFQKIKFEFSTILKTYLEIIHQINNKKQEDSNFNHFEKNRAKLNFLNYFRELQIRESEESVQDIYTESSDHKTHSNEEKFFLNLEKGVLDAKEIIAKLETIHDKYFYDQIIERILPTPAPIGEAADYWKPFKLIEKYQKDIFWYIFKQYDKERSNEQLETLRNATFYAIQKKKGLDWYKNKPDDLKEQQIELSDWIMLEIIFFDEQLTQIPDHLKEIAKKFMWRYWMFSEDRFQYQEFSTCYGWYS